ncbi:MAG: hypothetical protein II359_07670 [Clostridia bacterium]|nr:hypothetical protein [Clostridia bacterium]
MRYISHGIRTHKLCLMGYSFFSGCVFTVLCPGLVLKILPIIALISLTLLLFTP